MTPGIRRYLFSYIAGRRAAAIVCAIGWATAFAIGWMILCQMLMRWLPPARWIEFSELVFGVVLLIAILGRPIIFLFRRRNLVAAAIEIESHRPDFDQRLITAASQPHESDLLAQLTTDVEVITGGGTGRSLVPLRPLLAPALAVLAAVLLAHVLRLNALDLLATFVNRSGK